MRVRVVGLPLLLGASLLRAQASAPAHAPPSSLLQEITQAVELVHAEVGKMHAIERTLGALQTRVAEMADADPTAAGEPSQFVAVFDGGSTGTRLNVYMFDAKGLTLQDHLLESTEPGIHEVTDPAQTISELLEKGQVFLTQHGHTGGYNFPVVFNGTAGLRLLDASARDKVLGQVKAALSQRLGRTDVEVRVIDGKEEGFYAWSALVFVTQMKEKIGIIDLGGGSAQISFEIDKDHQASEEGVVHGKAKNVLSRSFLGMGLVAGLQAVRQSDAQHVCQRDAGKFDIAKCKRHIKSTVEQLIRQKTGGKEAAPGISQITTIFVSSYISEILQMIQTVKQTKFQDLKNLVDVVCNPARVPAFTASYTLSSGLAANPKLPPPAHRLSCVSVIYAVTFMESLGVGLFTPVKDAALIPVDISWSLGRALSLIE